MHNITKVTLKIIQFTRKEYDLIAKNRGIKEPQNMSTEELLDTPSRYDSKRKAESNHRKLLKLLKIKPKKIAKIQNISKHDLRKAENLKNKSIDELEEIARL